ncbi:unnamed protein product (macronuclear) [Paramecium tetraurelia]|uniref:Protein kinase domain-containing protein n=1 Tax=Paramecium tetraurelia TaxID=5888 RepID=A0D062_PARTE|nr:uncharacterized protein GSPATT00011981001 [Paramecium tetraurelia]CAK76429.1 unnamed protein product [Paramecium tetraurelia]|eukprot:XP_001443826.1 hypothetical protein (macronuclear) [Paramecium tetraurelia strain d4-2]
MKKEVAGFKINLSKQLGRGAFATVYECQKEGIIMPLCVKVIHLMSDDVYDQQALIRETNILKYLTSFHHPHIINVVDIHQDQQQRVFYVFMEKCIQGHIENTIKARASTKQFFSAAEIIEMTTQIIQGYSLLYKNSIIHRDLKPENLLYGNDGKIKISDFGMSKILDKEARNQLVFQSQVGTPYYASPQVLDDGKYSSKTDVFSLGVIVYYFTFLKLPFDKKTFTELKLQQMALLKNKTLVFPEMKIQGENYEKDLLIRFMSETITFYEETRIDWPTIFKMFLPPEESVESAALVPQQSFESIIQPKSDAIIDNRGQQRSEKAFQSYQVRTLISNLMAREELASSVQQYLICLNKYTSIFSNQDKNMLKAALCGYQMAINLNQIFLISNQYDQVCKQIQETFRENNIKIECESYMNDKYEKVEIQKQQVQKNSQSNLIQFKESIQQVLQGEAEIKDEALKKFKILLSKAEQQPNYEIYAQWFNYYYQKYIISKMQKYLNQAQEEETLMFLALSKKFVAVEKDYPIKDFFSIIPLYISYMDTEKEYLKQYLRANPQQQQIIDSNRNEK